MSHDNVVGTDGTAQDTIPVESRLCEITPFMFINVILAENLVECLEVHQTTDIFNTAKVGFRQFRVEKTQTIGDFVDVLVVEFHTTRERMRIWPVLRRRNQPNRLSPFEWALHQNTPLVDCAERQDPWPVYLEMANGDAVHPFALPPFDRSTQMFIFFVFYGPAEKRLLFCGSGYFAMASTFLDLVPDMCARAGLPNDTNITIYEEHSADMLQTVSNQADTLWRVLKVHPRKRRFSETLMHWIWPDQQITRNVDGLVLIFEKSLPPMSNASYAAFTSSANPIPTHDASVDPLISIPDAIIATSQDELGNKKHFKCLWLSIDMNEEMQLNIFPDKAGTVQTLLVEAAKHVPFNKTKGSGRLRIVEVHHCMLQPGPPEDELLEHLQSGVDEAENGDQKMYRIEEVPRDEANLAEDELLVPVFRYHTDPSTPFGVPFLVLAKQGEMYGVLKERIRRKIGNDQMKVVLVKGTEVDDVADAVEVNLVDFQPTDIAAPVLIGVEHQPHEPECN